MNKIEIDAEMETFSTAHVRRGNLLQQIYECEVRMERVLKRFEDDKQIPFIWALCTTMLGKKVGVPT